MNTIHLLIGVVGALLVVLLGMNLSGMQKGTSRHEVDSLRQQVEALQRQSMELDQLRLAGSQQPIVIAPTQVAPVNTDNTMPVLPDLSEEAAPAPAPTPSVVETNEAEDLEALRDEVAKEIAAETEEAILSEEPLAQQFPAVSDATQTRRAKVVKQALLTAEIIEVDSEGGFAAAEIKRDGAVQEQMVLAVRRGDGIAGRVSVSSFLNANMVVVDPVPGTFLGGSSNLVVGDELIVPPFN